MPWQMSYAAIAENESAELQTDVMRFMAILAFCLVAIFAIVQSLPAPPAPVIPHEQVRLTDDSLVAAAMENEPPPANPAQPLKARVAAAMPPQPIRLQRAAPVAKPAPASAEPVLLRRALPAMPDKPVPVATTPVDEPTLPVPDMPSAPVKEPGLSLRFESDAVLRSLVERGLVSLYAINGSQFFALRVAGGRVQFVPATAPGQYHEMIAATVPIDIQHSAPVGGAVTWGVTLPAATSQQLQRFVRTNYSGNLVITGEAQLALDGRGA